MFPFREISRKRAATAFAPGVSPAVVAIVVPVVVPVVALVLVLVLVLVQIVPVTAASDARETPPPLAPDGSRQEVLERVGFWPYGQALAVSVDPGRRLVFLGSGGAVLVLDIQDPSAPQLLSDSLHTLGLVLDICYDPATRRLFLACGEGGLEIWDVADPSNPTLLVNHEVLNYGFETFVDDVEVSGHFAIVDVGYVAVLDVSDPTQPVLVGGSAEMGNSSHDIFLAREGFLHAVGAQAYVRFAIDANGQLHSNGFYSNWTGGAFEVAGSNETAYATHDGYIYVLDPDDPYTPVYSTYYVGHNVSDLDLAGSYLYFIRGFERELVILDVSNPYNLVQVGSITLDAGSYRIELDGDLVHLADGYGGLRTIDASDPANPDEVGAYETLSRTATAKRRGDHVYLAEHDDGVLVIDVANLAAPTLVGQYDTPGFTYDVDIVDDVLYVADYDGGLRIADLGADPTAPVEMASLDVGQAHKVEVDGDYAYVVDEIVNEPDWLRVVDVSDPSAPWERGSLLVPGEAMTMDPAGTHLYVAAKEAGLRILNVADPDVPVEVAVYPAPEVFDVEVVGDRAYLACADWDGGFLTLDVSNPENPVLVSRYYEVGHFFWDVELIDDFAYVTAPSADELFVLHLGDEANPVSLGTYVTPGGLFDVMAWDEFVFVADGSAGLRILENTLFSTPSGGVGWDVLSSGTTKHLRGVHFASVSAGWAVGNDGTVLATGDGGDIWQPQAGGTQEDLFAVHFVDSQTGWIGGREGVLRHTTDGGVSWTPQASGTDEQIRDLFFVDADNGWAACTGGRILHTSDGGEQWQLQSSGTGEHLFSVQFLDAERGWIATQGDGLLLATENGGASWTPLYVPTGSGLTAVWFVDSATGWVSTSNADVFKTEDGGATWSEQLHVSGVYGVLGDIQFVNPFRGWVVGSVALEGRSYRTSDGGGEWVEMQGGRENYLQALHFVDALHGWAVGHYGTILRASAVPTAVPGEDPGNGPQPLPALLTVRPNPFNPLTDVRLTLRQSADLELDVFDIQGRRIRRLAAGTLDVGDHVFTWTGRDDRGRTVPSGVYFARLRTRTFTSTEKMVLLR